MPESGKPDRWSSVLETLGLPAPQPAQKKPETAETEGMPPPAPVSMLPPGRGKAAGKPKSEPPKAKAPSYWSKIAGALGLEVPSEPEPIPEPPAAERPVEAPRRTEVPTRGEASNRSGNQPSLGEMFGPKSPDVDVFGLEERAQPPRRRDERVASKLEEDEGPILDYDVESDSDLALGEETPTRSTDEPQKVEEAHTADRERHGRDLGRRDRSDRQHGDRQREGRAERGGRGGSRGDARGERRSESRPEQRAEPRSDRRDESARSSVPRYLDEDDDLDALPTPPGELYDLEDEIDSDTDLPVGQIDMETDLAPRNRDARSPSRGADEGTGEEGGRRRGRRRRGRGRGGRDRDGEQRPAGERPASAERPPSSGRSAGGRPDSTGRPAGPTRTADAGRAAFEPDDELNDLEDVAERLPPRRPPARSGSQAGRQVNLADEGEDAEGGEGDLPTHRKIPTWQEAVGILIDANMASRASSPDRDRDRGRGGRGRGRGGRGR